MSCPTNNLHFEFCCGAGARRGEEAYPVYGDEAQRSPSAAADLPKGAPVRPLAVVGATWCGAYHTGVTPPSPAAAPTRKMKVVCGTGH